MNIQSFFKNGIALAFNGDFQNHALRCIGKRHALVSFGKWILISSVYEKSLFLLYVYIAKIKTKALLRIWHLFPFCFYWRFSNQCTAL
jgi:hypothetical protein